MSGPAAAGVGGGYGGLYQYHGGHGGDPATATAVQLCYYQQLTVPPCAAGDGTTAYASIADYLQGFLDHEGLAAHFGSGDVDGQLAGAAAPAASSSVLSSSGCCEAGAGADHETPPRPEGRVEREGEAAADAEADRNCKRRSNEKTTRGENEKAAARGPRVAFVTKSEVDHLEDGYRWRKYGQKAVKNSTYPRSYYRCTAARCGVKKRVERSQQDPSTVVTTYEGQHTHPSPVVGLRLGGGGALVPPAARRCTALPASSAPGRPSTVPTLLAPAAAAFCRSFPGGMGGGGQLSSSSLPSIRRRPSLLQEPQHHRAHPSQLPAVDAYDGVLDLVPSVPR